MGLGDGVSSFFLGSLLDYFIGFSHVMNFFKDRIRGAFPTKRVHIEKFSKVFSGPMSLHIAELNEEENSHRESSQFFPFFSGVTDLDHSVMGQIGPS